MAMAGRASGPSRLAQARAWVMERALRLDAPASTRLVCETAAARLGVSGATLTVDVSSGWPETRDATDALGRRLAELQVTLGEGPSLDARRAGGPVLVADLGSPASQRRWPLFASSAVEAGAQALFALPMCVGAIRVGVLAAHRALPGHLDAATLRDALAFAELALRMLLDEHAGLPAAADDGAPAGYGLSPLSMLVHQATGMVSAQLDLAIDDAFARLRAQAFADRRPLADLAADVVARRVRFDPVDNAP